MTPLINELSFTEYQDSVCPSDLTEAMGDDKSRALFGDLFHGPLDLVFCGAVYSACRVVEDQDPRIGEKSTGDGDSLPLSS